LFSQFAILSSLNVKNAGRGRHNAILWVVLGGFSVVFLAQMVDYYSAPSRVRTGEVPAILVRVGEISDLGFQAWVKPGSFFSPLPSLSLI
jgi:hypothetical protein